MESVYIIENPDCFFMRTPFSELWLETFKGLVPAKDRAWVPRPGYCWKVAIEHYEDVLEALQQVYPRASVHLVGEFPPLRSEAADVDPEAL